MESGYDFEPDPTNGFGAIYFPGSMTEMGVQCWRSIFGSGWTEKPQQPLERSPRAKYGSVLRIRLWLLACCGSMRGIMGLSFKAASKAAHYAL
ncbi:MAG: hypothetical protein FRX49_11854 [Trebouxia sp. A1-2]|nr:MAG: hypothetical protein FRX49_11854 [Trebouxia sp. A1-2]